MNSAPAIDCQAFVLNLVNALNAMGHDFIAFKKNDQTGNHYYTFKDVASNAQFYASSQTYGVSRQGKVNVSVDLPNEWYQGGWPSVYDGNERMSLPLIAMSVSKDVEAQAKDFLRRLFADGVKYWNLCKEYVDNQNKHKNTVLDTKKALADIRGKGLDSYEMTDGRDELYLGNKCRAKVYGGRVDLVLDNLNVDQVRDIMKIVNK